MKRAFTHARAVTICLIMMMAALLCSRALASDAQPTPDPYIDEANNIGAIDATDLNGEPFARASLIDSKLVMFNFWATWCPPCLQEMPALGDIARERADTGFTIVGVLVDAVDENGIDETAISIGKEIMSELGVEYTVIIPDDTLWNGILVDMYAVPTTVFTDSHGNIIASAVGARSKLAWNEMIDELLTKAAQNEDAQNEDATTAPAA